MPLRAALRVCRIVVLATQTPATRVLNGPQPKRACVIIPSGCCSGAGVSACADETRAKPATVTAINLSIVSYLRFVPLADSTLETRGALRGDPRGHRAANLRTSTQGEQVGCAQRAKKALQMYLYSPPTADSWEGRDLGEAISATMGSAGAIAVRS